MLSTVVNYDPEQGSRISGILASLLLWVLIFLSVFFSRQTRAAVSKLEEKLLTGHKGEHRGGAFCFALTPAGKAADTGMVLSAVLLLLHRMGAVKIPYYFRMLPFSLLVISILLHCFFNGKSYVSLYRMTRPKKKKKREESNHE